MKVRILLAVLASAGMMPQAEAGLIVGTGSPQIQLQDDGNGVFSGNGLLGLTSYISPAALAQADESGATQIDLSDPNSLTIAQAIVLVSGQSQMGQATNGASLLFDSGGDLYVNASITLAPLDLNDPVRTLTFEAADTIYIAEGVTFTTATPVIFDAPHVVYEGQAVPEPPAFGLLGLGFAAAAGMRVSRSRKTHADRLHGLPAPSAASMIGM